MLENLGSVERHVYRAYWDDGLLDVFASTGVLGTGLFWMIDYAAAAAIVPAVLVPLWAPARRRFVEPRLGMVEFTESRERRNTQLLRVVLFAGIASLILGLELYFFRDKFAIDPSVSMIAGLPALLLALMAIVVSLLVASLRFLIYAFVLVVAGVSGALAGWPPGPILAAAGGVMLVIAARILAGFFMTNPYASESDE